MRILSLSLILLFSSFASAGEKIWVKDGFAMDGYDVVSYRDEEAAKEGKDTLVHTYNGVQFKFSSQANLDKFKASPEVYIPAYGGHCAWAMAEKGSVVSSNAKKFIVTQDEKGQKRVLLFYSTFFAKTKKLWEEKVSKGSPEEKAFIKQGDVNWAEKGNS